MCPLGFTLSSALELSHKLLALVSTCIEKAYSPIKMPKSLLCLFNLMIEFPDGDRKKIKILCKVRQQFYERPSYTCI